MGPSLWDVIAANGTGGAPATALSAPMLPGAPITKNGVNSHQPWLSRVTRKVGSPFFSILS